jgi:hypothetical protein
MPGGLGLVPVVGCCRYDCKPIFVVILLDTPLVSGYYNEHTHNAKEARH